MSANIKRALIWFLADDDCPLIDELRNTARQTIRQRLKRKDGGVSIFNSVIPQGKTQLAAIGNLAITITRRGGFTYSSINRPIPATSPILDIDIWARNVSFDVVEEVSDDLRDLLVSYPHNATNVQESGSWGSHGNEIRIGDVSLENEPFETESEPDDGSGDWLINYVLPFRIGHSLVVPAA